MADTKNKTNEDAKVIEPTPSKHARRLEYIVLYKSTGKSDWTLYPQMFIDKKQAELKIKLSVQAEIVHVIKLDLP